MNAKDYECPICMELISGAVETKCCGNLMCSACAKALQGKKCALCQSESFVVQDSRAVRKIIGNLRTTCATCGYGTTVSELPAHQKECAKGMCACTYCGFKARQDKMLEHLVKDHAPLVLQVCTVAVNIEQQQQQQQAPQNAGIQAARTASIASQQQQNQPSFRQLEEWEKSCEHCKTRLVFRDRAYIERHKRVCDVCVHPLAESQYTWQCSRCQFDRCGNCTEARVTSESTQDLRSCGKCRQYLYLYGEDYCRTKHIKCSACNLQAQAGGGAWYCNTCNVSTCLKCRQQQR